MPRIVPACVRYVMTLLIYRLDDLRVSVTRIIFIIANLVVLFVCRGYNIGIRLIDEFLAKSNVSGCVDFKETAEVIAKVIIVA